MKEILIAVKNKIAMNLGNATYVCDNSDYRVVFDFDDEWDGHPVKTARFKYNGMYQEVVFSGSACDMPVIRDARLISIGVYAGNLQTSTPAVVHASQSILSGDAAHDAPAEDVYNQLVELMEEPLKQMIPLAQLTENAANAADESAKAARESKNAAEAAEAAAGESAGAAAGSASAASDAATEAEGARDEAVQAAARAEEVKNSLPEDYLTLIARLKSGAIEDAELHLGFYLDADGDLCQKED